MRGEMAWRWRLSRGHLSSINMRTEKREGCRWEISQISLLSLICLSVLYVMARLRDLARRVEIADQAVGSDVERASAVHALSEHDLAVRMGEHLNRISGRWGRAGTGFDMGGSYHRQPATPRCFVRQR
jgi:hypothetical protein